MQHLFDTKLVCPKCDAGPAQGLDIPGAHCTRCDTCFFALNGLPCWFPAGLQQQLLWQDVLAKYIEQSAWNRQQHEREMALPDISPSNRQRLGTMAEVRSGTQQAVIRLLQDAGLTPQKHPQFQSQSAEALAQYYELMLRDWAWLPQMQSAEYRHYTDENQQSLQAIMEIAGPHLADFVGDMLVIGAGAGRLSWDLHCQIKTRCTIALDQNPLLIYLSHHLIKKRGTLDVFDTRRFPHSELPRPHKWTLRCDDVSPGGAPPGVVSQERRDTWFAFAGDAWALPFAEQSFDLIVTPWFLDITGRDCRDLIATVERVLRPGGYWLNYGPLLYSDKLPESQKYTFQELRELLQMARFNILGEGFFNGPYTHSPLSQRGRVEEVWTFLAQSARDRTHLTDAGECSTPLYKNNPPSWLVLPHLPVPRLRRTGLPDWMDNILALMDGKRSIHDLAEVIAPNLPEGHDPYQFIYSLFDQYLLQ